MAVDISVDFDLDSFNELSRAERSAMRRAKRQAVRETLFDAQRRVKGQIQRNFNNPKRYVVNSVLVKTKPMTGNDPTFLGEIYVNDWPSRGGTAANEILYPHIHLGQRADKRGEMRLRQIGVLPQGFQVVPARGYTDGRGSIKKGLMTKILSDLNAFPEYMTMNRVNSGVRSFTKRGRASTRVAKPKYFALQPGNNVFKAKPGIYTFVGKGGTRRPEIVLAFVKIAYRTKRIFFYEAVERAIAQVFPERFNYFSQVYTRSGSPGMARFVRSQARFRQKVAARRRGVGLSGPIPQQNISLRRRPIGTGIVRR